MAGIITSTQSLTTEEPAGIPTDTSTGEMSTNTDSGNTSEAQADKLELGTLTSVTSDSSPSSTDSLSSSSSSDTSSTPKKTFLKNMPKFNTTDWYKHKCFDRYWSHYQHVTDWYRKHCQVSRALRQNQNSYRQNQTYNYNVHSFTSQMFPQMYNSGSYWSSNTDSRPNQTSSNKNRKAKKRPVKCQTNESKRSAAVKRKQSDLCMDVEVEDVGSENGVLSSDVPELVPIEEPNSAEMEMDFSEEMLDFFAKSQRHRREREAEKKADIEKQKAEKRINIEEASGLQKERTSEAPREQPGSRRTVEMKRLYGKGAALIHGMETALQMTYDRNYDANQPRYWPNMPFRIVFADG